jgi:hypothetical protein
MMEKKMSQPLPPCPYTDNRMMSTTTDAGVKTTYYKHQQHKRCAGWRGQRMLTRISSSEDARYTASRPSKAVVPLTSDSHMLVNNASARVVIAARAT